MKESEMAFKINNGWYWKSLYGGVQEFSQVTFKSYIVSILKSLIHGGVHIMMIQRHEGSVDNNAERDEEVDEGVKDNDGEKLG